MTDFEASQFSKQGSLTLVGAGPGDPDLLTWGAIKALQQATVVLVDDLVGSDVLQMIPSHAQCIEVGKRGGCRQSTPQPLIQDLMIHYATQNEHVVRLKGGDPLVFGRAGEELQAVWSVLAPLQIPIRVINGITSGLAAANALGCSWTHRDHAQGVLLITGHRTQKPTTHSTDWVMLGQVAYTQRLTLVIYMGVMQLQEIVADLLKHLPSHTPAAMVQHASLPQEIRFISTLNQLVATAAHQGIQSPSIVMVGDVLQSVVPYQLV